MEGSSSHHYEKLRAELAYNFSWTFETIDTMTFDQIASAVCMGKYKEGIPVRSAEDVARINRNWRKYIGV